jgi:hypothetical protein
VLKRTQVRLKSLLFLSGLCQIHSEPTGGLRRKECRLRLKRPAPNASRRCPPFKILDPRKLSGLLLLRPLSVGRCYEADVVKALIGFSVGWALVFAFAVVSEERASNRLTQKTVTAQCEAKLAQERNGINGRGPRSGKQTFMPASTLSKGSEALPGVERLNALLKWAAFQALADNNPRARFTRLLTCKSLVRPLFLERFPPET